MSCDLTLNLGDTGRATNEDNLVNSALLDLGVLNHLLNGLDGALESLVVDVLETGTGDLGVEVLAVEEGVDLNGGLGTVGESTLGTLASSTETAEGTGVAGDVLLSLLQEFFLEVLEKVGVEVLTTLGVLVNCPLHFRILFFCTYPR